MEKPTPVQTDFLAKFFEYTRYGLSPKPLDGLHEQWHFQHRTMNICRRLKFIVPSKKKTASSSSPYIVSAEIRQLLGFKKPSTKRVEAAHA